MNGRWGLKGRRGGWGLSWNRTRLGHQGVERNAIRRDLSDKITRMEKKEEKTKNKAYRDEARERY